MIQLPLLFKALSDENRFKMINLLLAQPYCVGALANQLGISEAAVSQHLQLLRKAGLVKGEKRGYWTHYIVDKDLLIRLGEKLKNIASQPLDLETLQQQLDPEKERKEANIGSCNCPHPDKLKGQSGECSPGRIY